MAAAAMTALRAMRPDGGTGRPRRRAVMTAGAVVAVVGAESFWLAPYATRAARQLTGAHPLWLALAVLAEVASMLGFARLQRLALGTGGLRVPFGSSVSTVFAGNAMSVTLPGGSLVSIGYRTHRMRSLGASAPLIGFTHIATGVLSTIALAVLAGVGRTLAGEGSQLVWVGVRVAVVCALTGAVLALLHHPALLRRPVDACLRLWRRFRPNVAGSTSADRLLDELAAMRPPAGFWMRGLAVALVNWAGDLGCLVCACHAVDATPALGTALLAYVAGMAAASAMPLLPAGLGALDAALVVTLHHGGVPLATATAADLLYRTISPGLIAVVGWLVLLGQRRRRRVVGQPVADSGQSARTASGTASTAEAPRTAN